MTPHRITVLPFAAPQCQKNPEAARLARGLATLMESRLREVPGALTFLQHFLARPRDDDEARHYMNRTRPWRLGEILELPSPDGIPSSHFVYGLLEYGDEITYHIGIVDVAEGRSVYRHEATVPQNAFIESFYPQLAVVARTIEPRTPSRVLRELAQPGTRDLIAFRHYLLGLSHRAPISVGGGAENPFEYFENALHQDPGFLDSCVAIDTLAQECFRDHRDESRALDVLRRAASEVEHFPQFRRTLGIYLFDKGELDEARPLLESYVGSELKDDPAAPGAFVRLGAIYRRDSGPATALQLLKRAAQLFPRDADILESLGICHAETGNLIAAERCWRRVLEENPTRPISLSNLGLVLWHRGDLDRARILLERSIESPDSGEASFSRLLDFLIEAKQFERADSVATEWVEHFPENWRGWVRLAYVRLAKGDHDAARYCLRKVEEYSETPESRREIRIVRFALRAPGDYARYRDAIKELPAPVGPNQHTDDEIMLLARAQTLRQLATAHPEQAFLWFALATCLRRAGDYRAAYEAQHQALQIDGESAKDFHRLATIAEKAELPAEAIVAHCQALELAPGLAASRIALASILIDQERLHEAKAIVAKGLAIDPDNAPLRSVAERIESMMAACADFDERTPPPGIIQRLKHMFRQRLDKQRDGREE